MREDVKRLLAEVGPDRDCMLGDTGYRVKLWYAGLGRDNRPVCAYQFYKNDGSLLFEGDDYGPSPMICVDSDEAVRGLIFFLCIGVGDTDDEYFRNYTDEQLEWAREPNTEREWIDNWSDGEMHTEDTSWTAEEFPLVDVA